MSEQAPTHINAFYVELAEAEKEVAQAQGRVDALKETIATMEQAQSQPTDTPVEAAPEVPAEAVEAPVEDHESSNEQDELPAESAPEDKPTV